jgi:hypothetical protein
MTGESSAVSPHDAVPEGVKVERFALSYILMPFRNYPRRSITVINPHPDTWNSFMFPYGGLRLEDTQAASGVTTFEALSASLNALVRNNLEDYVAGARDELLAYYSDIPDLYETPPAFRNYSLKFSKSAQQWTAYIFTYHTCGEHLLTASGLAHSKIYMTSESVQSALQAGKIEGVTLEENVVAFLRSNVIRFWSSVDI